MNLHQNQHSMPLSTVSANIPRSRSHARSSSKGFSDAGSSTSSIPPPPPPMAVQSMLRSTTELGDIGQLPLTRAHRSRSVSHMRSIRRRSGSYDSSITSGVHRQRSPRLRHGGRHYESRRTPSMSELSRHNTVRSSLRSYQHKPRPRDTRVQTRQYGLQGPQDTTIPARPLYSHRSLVTLRSYGEAQSRRPTSPFPPYGQRSADQRVASPAFGPGPGYHAGVRLPILRAGSRGSAASSPASMYLPPRGYPGLYTDGGHSLMPLVRWPSPAVHSPVLNSRMMPHISRRGTPIAGFAHGPHGGSISSIIATSETPRSPAASVAPRYYDYSESFIQEEPPGFSAALNIQSYQHAIGPSVPEDQTSGHTRHAQTPFGTRPGSSFHPVELPTKHNRRTSEHSINSLPPTTIPARRSSLGFTSQATKQDLAETEFTQKNAEPSKASAGDETIDRRFSSSSRRARESTSSGTFFPNSSRSPRDLTALVARMHSPNETDKQCISTPVLEESPPGKTQNSRFSNARPNVRPQIVSSLQVERGPVIVSPRPERPLSSQSRKKFSKILELDEQANKHIKTTSESTFAGRGVTRLSRLDEIPSPKQSHESIKSQNGQTWSDGGAERLSNKIVTPNQESGLSTVTSHGKSTVESLLDHHIESLGLGPGPYSPSENQDKYATVICPTDDESITTIRLPDRSRSTVRSATVRPATSGTCRPSSLDSDANKKLMPRRLFSSMDARFTSLADIVGATNSFEVSFIEGDPSNTSSGWQTLTSDSHISSTMMLSKPSIMSGEFADIDTSAHSKRFKVRRRSRMSQTSANPELPFSTAELDEKKTRHRRSRSDMMARKESHRRRGMRIDLKLGRRSNSMGQLMSRRKHHEFAASTKNFSNSDMQPAADILSHHVGRLAELSGDSATPVQSGLTPGRSSPANPAVPNRWSSMMAAMPLPNAKTSCVRIPRQTSFRSYHSHRSNVSLAEPSNTTRIDLLTPSLGNMLPKLAPSNFGPSLAAPGPQLNLLYTDANASNGRLLKERKSYSVTTTPGLEMPRATKMKFGLSSLRSILPGSSGGVNRDSLKGSDLMQISQSCQMQGRRSTDDLIIPDDTIPMSNFTYRKRKVMKKLSDWWNGQCMQKRLATRKSKASRNLPGGMLVG